MKLLLCLPLALALSVVTLFASNDDRFKEPFSQQGAFSPTGKVTLQSINGHIEIETWDKNEISISGEKFARTEEEMKRIELTIERSESRTDIKVNLPKRTGGAGNKSIRGGVRFILKVPATATLERINSVNSSIEIDGARGEVNVETVNGQIRAQDLAGDARLKTVNGQVLAHFSDVRAEQKLTFDTVNGTIAIEVPEDAGFQLQTKVVNGHIDCDFPVEMKGRVSGKRISGKIGDGRATLSAESVNGRISIKKS
jgi:DUF4097 and DUF4098 domain-containing protein YvlB